MYVALSGNIGSGKSTWTVRLAEILRVPAFPERPELNPWFAEPDLAALEEMRFIVSSATDVAALHAGRDGGVVERVPAEHVAIFGAAKRELGLL
ncbi:MAG: Deoxynucleoside kinase, partial [Solirubrobacteraceae bacterium]|nr:Deoxynucleoside kinase [Solirubrobacteraceae bacterium]